MYRDLGEWDKGQNLMEHHAMQQKFTRRDVLNSASGLVAATALGGLINNDAVASEELSGHAQDELAHNQAFAPIDHVLRQAADSNTVAGVVALGATEKGVVYEGAFGKADMNAGSKISPDTVFWLLSMTKAITATACMQLIEHGKLQLDQPASQILPELSHRRCWTGSIQGDSQSFVRPNARSPYDTCSPIPRALRTLSGVKASPNTRRLPECRILLIPETGHSPRRWSSIRAIVGNMGSAWIGPVSLWRLSATSHLKSIFGKTFSLRSA
jgi:hypothetical protein